MWNGLWRESLTLLSLVSLYVIVLIYFCLSLSIPNIPDMFVPTIHKECYTLSHNPSEAIIKNWQSEFKWSFLISGSDMIHSFKCRSPMALETASVPWALQTPFRHCTKPPCNIILSYFSTLTYTHTENGIFSS